MFSTFPSCSQVSVVFFHSAMHGLGFICEINKLFYPKMVPAIDILLSQRIFSLEIFVSHVPVVMDVFSLAHH